MILKASQRGGGMALASHLLSHENEHVTVHEIRGFVSNTVTGAFKEAYAISKGTKCQQFLFSLSLNPPQEQSVGEAVFEDAANEAEERLGLEQQPRVIVFHEKEGRRHAHVVWSRIDANKMTAINLSHFKNKLTALSKEIYLKHGWDLPEGFKDPSLRNPTNFTLAEWQQAARHNRDPREIKQVFQKSWKRSDGAKAYTAALKQNGFMVARGDRRGFVAVDYLGGVYSISKYTSLRTKAVKARLGDPQALPSIEEAKEKLRANIKPALKTQISEKHGRYCEIAATLKREAREMAASHKAEREVLSLAQSKRAEIEHNQRQSRYSTGLVAVWDALTGKRHHLRKQIESEAWACAKRDQEERDALIYAQLKDRKVLQKRIENARTDYAYDRKYLGKQIGAILSLDREKIAARHDRETENKATIDTFQEKRVNPSSSPNYGRDGPSFF